MSEASRGVHLATLAHEGRIWDAYLEFDDESSLRDFRGRVRFSSPEADRIYRTTVIIIESSHEEAVHRARSLETRQLEALLRSVLPDAEE
jgi:hypothetical protein